MPTICEILFFFNDTATTEIYTLSLHDALPILSRPYSHCAAASGCPAGPPASPRHRRSSPRTPAYHLSRSEEHTSELQSRQYLVCRLLLEKKKKNTTLLPHYSTYRIPCLRTPRT